MIDVLANTYQIPHYDKYETVEELLNHILTIINAEMNLMVDLAIAIMCVGEFNEI